MNRLYLVMVLLCLVTPNILISAEVKTKYSKEQEQKLLDNQLFMAAKNNNLEAFTEALNAGANINEALLYAAGAGNSNTAIMQFLLDNGANIEARNRVGKTPLMFAVSLDNYAKVKFLLDNGADANALDDDSRTALIHAAATDYPNIVQLLLKHGANTKLKDIKDKTALDYARMSGNNDVVKILLAH